MPERQGELTNQSESGWALSLENVEHPGLANALYYFRDSALWMMIDLSITIVAYLAALSVRGFLAPVQVSQDILFILFVAITMVVALHITGAYKRIWSQTSGHDVVVIVSAVIAATIVITIVNLADADKHLLPISVVFIGSALTLSGMVVARYRSRLITGMAWRWRAVWHLEFPQKPTRVLVVGAGECGQAITRRLRYHTHQGERYIIVGFVDDNLAKRRRYIEGVQVLGTRHAIPRLVEEENVDLIVIAVHAISGTDFRDILAYCQCTNARIKVVPDMFDMISATCNAPLLREVRAEDLLGRKTVDSCGYVDLTPVRGKSILVTGAAGSIGSELCRQILAHDPTQLILLDNNESNLHDIATELRTCNPKSTLVPVLADICNWDDIVEVFDLYRPQVVFHGAAYKHVPMLEFFPRQAVRVNIGGTLNVGRVAQLYGAERFVLISTDKAVNPSNVMGASKRACELIVRALSTDAGHSTLLTAVRFGNVLGSRGSVVPTFNRQIENGGPVTVTDKHMSRYFMSIAEAVNLVIHAACLTQGGDLFFLKMGEEVRILDIAERMIRLRGLRPYEDIEIIFSGIRPGEKLREELFTGIEQPVQTIHPYIVQLDEVDGAFRPAAFIAEIERLLNACECKDIDVAARLFACADAQCEQLEGAGIISHN